MDSKPPLWISRKISQDIYDSIIVGDSKIVVWHIRAAAGMGKTFLAREVGVRLGSSNGYQSARQGRFLWGGILDLYDPAINSNRGIERQLIEALSVKGFEFDKYQAERDLYSSLFKGGITGTGLEEQRHRVENAFAVGLQEITKTHHPILVFDTIERLESASDPTQRELGFVDDTASVMGWLMFQIAQLKGGVVLLLGRSQRQFSETLASTIALANASPTRAGLPSIELRTVDLLPLDEEETELFFANRMERFPGLRLLDDELKSHLLERTAGNPLLLDLALQALLETSNPAYVRNVLPQSTGMDLVERELVKAYMNSVDNPDRQVLLRYLAVCRNGLFEDLLRVLEPTRADQLLKTLHDMEELPFIKVRDVSLEMPGGRSGHRHTVYFHDAMYALCDDVVLTPQQTADDSRHILAWYETQIADARKLDNARPPGERRLVPSPDLFVESVIYRLRADPRTGYQWYLQWADRLIRSAETGLDMRLHDGLALFLVSATPFEIYGLEQSEGSPIDRGNIQALMPELPDLFYLDSATLWVKRFTVRGRREMAERVGQSRAAWAETMFANNPEVFRLGYAEFLLWYGQALMYGLQSENALAVYRQAISIILRAYPETLFDQKDALAKLSGFDTWRVGLVLGRLHNNLGYTYWMYLGQYRRAIHEFQLAIRLFRIADLEEERANSTDNLGRVYALQGRQFQATQLIQDGLDVRKQHGLPYREALSSCSMAQALIRFGELDPALRAATDALAQFGRVGVERGIGLGLLTRGTIYRNLAENWVDKGLSAAEAIRYTDLAETDLREALRIFSGSVSEPIRLVQVRNEMGCCYRARYQLLTADSGNASIKNTAFAQGRIYFRDAIDFAENSHFFVEALDSMQDLAVLFYRAHRYDEAQQYLTEVRKRISDKYPAHIIQRGRGLSELEPAECIDACYKLMGQVELLEGTIAFDTRAVDTTTDAEKTDARAKDALLHAAEHFLLAVSYFNRYSGEEFARRLTYKRIYRRFKDCDPELIQEIVTVHLPKWVSDYGLPGDLVRSYFKDVFGLFN